jgi:hypothetical protein
MRVRPREGAAANASRRAARDAFPQRPEIRKSGHREKGGELRKRDRRRSQVGGMIGAVAMATRTRH